MVIMQTRNRLESGIVETAMKKGVADKTNWRAMLKGSPEPVDLRARLDDLREHIPEAFRGLIQDSEIFDIEYPVEAYPSTIKSYNFDKEPFIEDRLMGIKGQYLIFEHAVLNIRKFTGYEVEFSC